jgi:glutathione S-transferase
VTEELTLYHFPRTHTTRVRWWLEQAGIGYRSVPIDIRRREQDAPAFRALSPLGRIPVLVDRGQILNDSLAICLHLGFRFPAAALSPAVGSPQFADYLQWLAFGAAEANQAVGRCFAAHRSRHLGVSKTNEAHARDSFLQVHAIFEAQLQKTPFLAGPTLTAADLFNASVLAFADSFGLLPGAGIVRTWLDGLTALPSYARALAPDAAPDKGP